MQHKKHQHKRRHKKTLTELQRVRNIMLKRPVKLASLLLIREHKKTHKKKSGFKPPFELLKRQRQSV
jgi:hypothetical protein